MKRIFFLLLALLCIASHAHAGVTKTPRTGRVELRERTSSALIGQYETLQACIDAIPQPKAGGKVEYNCKAVTYIDVEGNCDGVDKPAPPPPTTTVVIYPEVVKPFDPYCTPGEKCLPVVDETPGVKVLPNGTTEYTFTNVGELRAVEKPDGSWATEEYRLSLESIAFPACWQWQWKWFPVELPPPEPPVVGFVPALDPGALDGEKQP
jgi:hypothetical protein